MFKSRWKIAFLLVLSLASIMSNSAAQDEAPQSVAPPSTGSCTPVLQDPVAPGDIIDLRGPDVPADQQALGIHWDYMWTVKEDDAEEGRSQHLIPKASLLLFQLRNMQKIITSRCWLQLVRLHFVSTRPA